MNRPSTPVLIAITLPLLLAVAVAVLAVAVRVGGVGGPPEADLRPLAIVPVDAPDASGPDCTALLAALDGDLPAADGTLPIRSLAEPAPAGVRAWAATPRPVVLRCGLPRPAELTPTSALLEVNGVRWLELTDGADPTAATWIAVDRPVYLAFSAPTAVGSGPLQQVSDAVRTFLAATPVAVR